MVDESVGTYLAGIIDGKGATVTISERRDVLRMYPVILVSHTNKDLLEYIKEIIGSGSIYQHGKGWIYRAEGVEPYKRVSRLTKGKLRSKHESISLLKRFMRVREDRNISEPTKRGELKYLAERIIELQDR